MPRRSSIYIFNIFSSSSSSPSYLISLAHILSNYVAPFRQRCSRLHNMTPIVIYIRSMYIKILSVRKLLSVNRQSRVLCFLCVCVFHFNLTLYVWKLSRFRLCHSENSRNLRIETSEKQKSANLYSLCFRLFPWGIKWKNITQVHE